MAKLKEIIVHLKSDDCEEFEELSKRWEIANQMRKWTQKIKQDLSESINK